MCVYQPEVRAYHEAGAFVDRRAPKYSPWAGADRWSASGRSTAARHSKRWSPSGDHLEGTLAVDKVHKLRHAIKVKYSDFRTQVKTLTRKNDRLERRLEEKTRKRAHGPRL